MGLLKEILKRPRGMGFLSWVASTRPMTLWERMFLRGMAQYALDERNHYRSRVRRLEQSNEDRLKEADYLRSEVLSLVASLKVAERRVECQPCPNNGVCAAGGCVYRQNVLQTGGSGSLSEQDAPVPKGRPR